MVSCGPSRRKLELLPEEGVETPRSDERRGRGSLEHRHGFYGVLLRSPQTTLCSSRREKQKRLESLKPVLWIPKAKVAIVNDNKIT